MKFSPENRITASLLQNKKLCRGCWGTQSDFQSIGYDALCALASLFHDPKNKIYSYEAIDLAQKEIKESPYSRGFQHGWDGVKQEEEDQAYQLGYADAQKIVRSARWENYSPSDSYRR